MAAAFLVALLVVLGADGFAAGILEDFGGSALRSRTLRSWITVPVAIISSIMAGLLLARVTRAVLGAAARRTRMVWDDTVVGRLTAPAALLWSAVAMSALATWLQLTPGAAAVAGKAVRAAVLAALFWALLRAVDIAVAVLADLRWTLTRPASRALVPFAGRIAKVLVVAAGLVTLLAELGYPVMSLVAGLGLGGLALALAAQKTVENLFGAFSLGVDQPFREGDFVRVDELLGHVESIGLRSTRIRTLDRTLVTIPNGRLSEMRIESFAARDRIRFACSVGVVYGTSAAQMRDTIAGIERLLRGHPMIWPENVVVRFAELGPSSLDIHVMAWFKTTDWNEFQLFRQDVLLGIIEEVERAGSSLAFPTRTVHVIAQDGAASAVGRRPDVAA